MLAGMQTKGFYRQACAKCGKPTFTVDKSLPICTDCKKAKRKAYEQKRQQELEQKLSEQPDITVRQPRFYHPNAGK